MRAVLILVASSPLAAASFLPFTFEPNRGQAPAAVQFLTTGSGPEGAVWFTPQAAILRTPAGAVAIEPQSSSPAEIVAEDSTSGVSHYLRGNDRARWITNVPHYRRVRYRNLYPGIDLLFYPGHSGLEYDLILLPGADPRSIRLLVRGARRLSLDVRGNLRIDTGAARIEERRPTIYQEIAGRRRPIPGRFALHGNEIRFAVAPYDRAYTLCIDPLIVYGTYLGGRSRDLGAAIAVDAAGNAYITGSTVSADFPVTANAVQIKPGGVPNSGISMIGVGDIFDAFVAKLSPDGSRLVYATFIGGSGSDSGLAIAVDRSGNAVVAGSTTSANFPLAPGAIQSSYPTGAASTGFISKLKADGSDFLFSTYFGGATGASGENTAVSAVAFDASNAVYLAGTTNAHSFPSTAGAFQTFLGGGSDAFAARLDPTGRAIAYATFLGGGLADTAYAIAVDASGNASIGGFTSSANFPVTAQAAQPTPLGATAGFVARLNPAGSALVYSTFLGGSGYDSVNALALDKDGSLIAAGSTNATVFPTTVGAFQPSLPGQGMHAFVARYDPAGAIQYATLLGGNGNESAAAVAVNADGSVSVAGQTTSSDFPLTEDAYQRSIAGTNCFTITSPFPPPPSNTPCPDGFLTILHVSGRRLVYSTYLGGSSIDGVTGLTLGSDGALYLAGSTGSNNFIVSQGAFQTARAGGNCTQISSPTAQVTFACEDAFVLKIDPSRVGPPRPSAALANAANGVGGPIAPGELVSLFGLNIGPPTPDTMRLGPDGRVLTTLSGVTVTFDGAAAPLIYVGPNQVNAIVPVEVAGKSSVTVHIVTPAYGADVATVPIAPTAPGLFSISGTGQNQAAALNQDLTSNSAANPAVRGTVITLYGTGGGITLPAGVDGRVATGLTEVVAPVSVNIGGLDAQVQYAGDAPNLVEGVIQINALIPAAVAPGPKVPVILTVGGVTTQPSLTIAVQ